MTKTNCSCKAYIQHYDATDCQCNFLDVPWESRGAECYAKGSSVVLDMGDVTLPQTKYAALFDGRPAFDDLRFSFLTAVCGHRLSALETQLQQGNLSEEALHAVLSFSWM